MRCPANHANTHGEEDKQIECFSLFASLAANAQKCRLFLLILWHDLLPYGFYRTAYMFRGGIEYSFFRKCLFFDAHELN